MNKIGMIGLLPKIENFPDIEFDRLCHMVGLNTGNLMFTNAIYKHISGSIERVGFKFDPDRINAEYDALIVPAANWINAGLDWDELIDIWKKVSVPIITVGIGLQADDVVLESVKISDSSLRLARFLASKSKYISCRGNFTRDWMRSVGINNAIVTGCPSLFMDPGGAEGASSSGAVVLQGTRYWMSEDFLNKNGINQSLYRLAGKLGAPMVYQSEPEEMRYLIEGTFEGPDGVGQRTKWLADLYGFDSAENLKSYLNDSGMVFFDIEKWSTALRGYAGVVGTRLHGAIIALNSGLPARLIAHDSRTSELLECAKIPTVSAEKIQAIKSHDDLLKILKETDLSEFFENKEKMSEVYIQFLEECGLSVRRDGVVRA